MENKNRLQFVHHNDLFATREEAIGFVLDKQNERFSLYAEPIIVKYGDATNPNIILAIGSEDGSISASSKTYFIDFSRHEESINAISEKISGSTEDIEKLKTLTEAIKDACGLNDDGTYKKSENKIIENAESLNGAINDLADYVTKHEINVADTHTIGLNIEETESGRTLSANVKLANTATISGKSYDNQLIIVEKDGLFVNVGLAYSGNGDTLKLIVNGNVTADAKIPQEIHVEDGFYNPENEHLVLNLNVGGPIEIDLEDLASEIQVWEDRTGKPISYSPIVLGIERVKGKETNRYGKEIYHSVIYGDVKITKNVDQINNILKIHSNGETDASLYVDGNANNINYKKGTVENALDSLNTNIEKVSGDVINTNDKINVVDNNLHDLEKEVASSEIKLPLVQSPSLHLNLDKTSTGTYLKGWVMTNPDSTNIIKGGGVSGVSLYASVKLEYSPNLHALRFTTTSDDIKSKTIPLNVASLGYDPGTNVLTYKDERENETHLQLNGFSIIDEATYDEDTEEIVIKYKSGGESSTERELRVPVSGIISEWQTSATTTVDLKKTRTVGKGSDILTADVKISSEVGNIVEKKEGGIYVSNSAITANTSEIADLKTRVGVVEGDMITINGKINTINGNEATEGSLANTLKKANDYTDEKITENKLNGSSTINIKNDDNTINVKVCEHGESSKYLKIHEADGLSIEGIDASIEAKYNESTEYTDTEINKLTPRVEANETAIAANKADIAANKASIDLLNADASVVGSVKNTADNIASSYKIAESKTIDFNYTAKTAEIVINDDKNKYLDKNDNGVFVGEKVDTAISNAVAPLETKTAELETELGKKQSALTAGDAIEFDGNKIDVKIDTTHSEDYLTIHADGGLCLSGIDAIKTDVTDLGNKVATISGSVTSVTTGFTELSAKVDANTNSINTITSTTIPNTLKEAKDYADAKESEAISSAKTYTDENKLSGSSTISIQDKVVSLKYNLIDKYLKVGEYGLETKGIDTAISDAVTVESTERKKDDDVLQGNIEKLEDTVKTIEKTYKWSVDDTLTVDLNKNDDAILTANVRVSPKDGNAIAPIDGGLYVGLSKLEYLPSGNHLLFTNENGVQQTITLNGVSVVENMNVVKRDSETLLVIEYRTGSGTTKELSVNVADFFKGITGDNETTNVTVVATTKDNGMTGISANLDVEDFVVNANSTVTLSKTSANRLVANVNIADIKNNILKIDDGTSNNSLYVLGTAENINYEGTKNVKTKIQELDTSAITNTNNITILSGKVETLETQSDNLRKVVGVKSTDDTIEPYMQKTGYLRDQENVVGALKELDKVISGSSDELKKEIQDRTAADTYISGVVDNLQGDIVVEDTDTIDLTIDSKSVKSGDKTTLKADVKISTTELNLITKDGNNGLLFDGSIDYGIF